MTTSDCPRCGDRVTSKNFGGWSGCFVAGRPIRSPVCRRCLPEYADGDREFALWQWVIVAGVLAFLVLAVLDIFGLL